MWINYRSGSWKLGAERGSNVMTNGQQVIGSRAAAVASPVGGSTVDSEARGSID